MKRRSFLKLLGITAIGLTVSPVKTVKNVLDIGIKNTCTQSYMEAKKAALLAHSIEIEEAFLYGIGTDTKTNLGIIRFFK